MPSKRRFDIVYAPQTKQHLRFIEKKYYTLIRKTIEEQLQFTPDVKTRNRKPLDFPGIFEADWEIRFGPDNRFRVFYGINEEHSEIHILAIGIKQGNRLYIGGEEIKG